MAAIYKPGEDNRPAGTYEEVGPRGGKLPDPRIVHIGPGDRLPPTAGPKHGWQRQGGRKH
ncbi:YjzC family protein [Bifidobacterium sp. AGR2158]|uniref:YjzC family protein n=1 Tax=Bifidobacterium sp. AGR2158 TaxID=1280675 RepID=UPI0009DC0176|nr:YjzC family protein [Bifidobacterium sp. AGR2158]